jgi:hypothetical protein
VHVAVEVVGPADRRPAQGEPGQDLLEEVLSEVPVTDEEDGCAGKSGAALAHVPLEVRLVLGVDRSPPALTLSQWDAQTVASDQLAEPCRWSHSRVWPAAMVPPPMPSRAANGPQAFLVIQTCTIGAGVGLT